MGILVRAHQNLNSDAKYNRATTRDIFGYKMKTIGMSQLHSKKMLQDNTHIILKDENKYIILTLTVVEIFNYKP